MKRAYSWGRVFQAPQRLWVPERPNEITRESLAKPPSVLPYGNGRSYGDSCSNSSGVLIATKTWDRLIALDKESGTLRCESGVLLSRCLEYLIPRGWFLPVVPGTQHVTVGGLVANDIHGKNHHLAGTIGRHIRRFELIRSDGKKYLCSPKKNVDLFRATIGGLGLTGIISWVEIALKRIPGPWMKTTAVPFYSLKQFANLCEELDGKYEYTVGWVDVLSKAPFARGILFASAHASGAGDSDEWEQTSERSIPIILGQALLNRSVVRLFNELYFQKNRFFTSLRRESLLSYFFPLDAFTRWNEWYGGKGFFQHQSVIPAEKPNPKRGPETQCDRRRGHRCRKEPQPCAQIRKRRLHRLIVSH